MNWILFIIVAGALQGILLSLIILRKQANREANIWLAAFIMSFAILTFSDVLDRTIQLHHNSALLHLFDWGILLLGPFLLMYLREMTGDKYKKKNSWFLHFLPAFIAFLIYFIFYSMPSDMKIKTVMDDQIEQANGNPGFLALLITLQIACYFIWGLAVLFRYSRHLKEHYSATEKRNLTWLKIFVVINLLIWFIWLFALYTSSNIARILNDIGFSISVYLLGYVGIGQIDLGHVRTALLYDENSRAEEKYQNNKKNNYKNDRPASRYEHSGLTTDRAAALRQKLDSYMIQDKPYLEEDLNLRELADRIDVLPHHLSQLLNEHYNKNFFEFINSYRVQEVKKMLSDPNKKNESILSIAFSSGFNSKATFNSFFKKYTGQTPRQFRTLNKS
ncbi:MAG: helix-turn-helix transcriptional regulator [Bacteroidetes bacterium]|nr:helix-turn-helix transcriptional regulator [Bacteroidota bacterium]